MSYSNYVHIRKDNHPSIEKVKAQGYVFVRNEGDLSLYGLKEGYVEKIKRQAQKVLGYVQVIRKESWLK